MSSYTQKCSSVTELPSINEVLGSVYSITKPSHEIKKALMHFAYWVGTAIQRQYRVNSDILCNEI